MQKCRKANLQKCRIYLHADTYRLKCSLQNKRAIPQIRLSPDVGKWHYSYNLEVNEMHIETLLQNAHQSSLVVRTFLSVNHS